MGRLFQEEGTWGTVASKLEGIWILLNEEGMVCDKTGEVVKRLLMLHHVDQSKKFRIYSKSNGSALKSFKLGNSVYTSRTLCCMQLDG